MQHKMETQLLDKKKPKLWTKEGLQALGDLIKESRKQLKLSQRDLSTLIEERTGCYVSDTNIGDIERNVKLPHWNTLAVIAAAEFALKADGTPYTIEDFAAIASQTYPKNGLAALCPKNDVSANDFDKLYPALHKDIEMSQGWGSEQACLRVQALIKASLKKMGLSGQPGTAAERAGIDPAIFDRAALRAFESGSLSRMLGTTITPGLEAAIASICYEVVGGWNSDNTPKNLGDRTYKDRPEQLLRDLHLNNQGATSR